MAFTDLDAQYKERIENPYSYTEMLDLSNFLKYEPLRKFGYLAPPDIVRGFLLFGYFTDDEYLQCQPWVAEPVKSGGGAIEHSAVSRELVKIHRANNNMLSFQHQDEVITREGWPMYLGKPISESNVSYSHIAYVGLFANSGDMFDEKLAAVARETKAAGALAGHVVCAHFAGYMGTYRVQDGTIETVSRGLRGGIAFREYQVV